MKSLQKPSLWLGAIVGAITAPVMIAIFFLGDRFAGLPFLPFDIFDFAGRVVPGGLITFVIDTMVQTLTALGQGSNLDDAAKASEMLMGLGMFFGMCVVISAVFFAIMNRVAPKMLNLVPSVVFGALFGVPMLLISASVNRTATANGAMSVVWILLVTVGWCLVVGSLYNTLAMMGDASSVDEKTKTGMNRRQFLVQAGGASAVITVVGAGFGALFTGTSEPAVVTVPPELMGRDGSGNLLPNANDPLQPAPGTRAEYTPVPDHYRIDISARPPVIDGETYTLPIKGNVANPVAWSLAEIRAMPATSAFITMSCISNQIGGSLISTTKWTGVSLQHILEQVQPGEGAIALKIVGGDGFDEYVTLDKIRNDDRIILAYDWDDQPLPQKNGFPLRIHLPNHYGMKQPKWITEIEVVNNEEEGYWVRRGWSPTAVVRSTSVIDTVASDAIYQDNGTYIVPIGGMAWAGARGISKVELSINGGEWVEAQLRSPLSERTWVIWRYDWAFSEGEHNFLVRCFEADGTMQIEEKNGTRPDGATGFDTFRATTNAPEATPAT
jgi:DMSO/TMAO reductase YedYZ molybdopterin-dependent catalytic subunit